jgi:hypothetical protein
MSSRRFKTLPAVVFLSIAGQALALPPVGGPGGAPFTADCGANKVMVHANVYTQDFVSALRIMCIEVNAAGEWLTSPDTVTDLDRVGGSQGTTNRVTCQTNWGAVGIHGKTGNVIDSLGLHCGRLYTNSDTSVKTAGSTEKKGPFGGPGGAPFDLKCPSGQVLTGLKGRAGNLIDSLDLICRYPSAVALVKPTVTLHVSPASGNAGALTLTASISGCCSDGTSTKSFVFESWPLSAGASAPRTEAPITTLGTTASWKPSLGPGTYGFLVRVEVRRNSDKTKITKTTETSINNYVRP